MCLSDDLQLNVVLDSILYYGMLCTLPIWLYPIVRVIKKTFNYNEILGVLAIILISGIVFVVGLSVCFCSLLKLQKLCGMRIRTILSQMVMPPLAPSSYVIGEE